MSGIDDMFDDKNFGDDAEVSSQSVDWGKPGDYILGTFIKARHNVKTQYGVNSIYEFLAERGQFHKLIKKKPVDNPTVINSGETWTVWGRNDIFDSMLNALKPGQIVKIQFAEERDTPMGTSKIVKVFAPKTNEGKPTMNQEWLDNQGVSAADM